LQLPDFVFSNPFLPFLSCFFLIHFAGIGDMVAGSLAAWCEAMMPLFGFVFHCFVTLFSLISAFFAGSDLHLISFLVFLLLYVVACFWPQLLAKDADAEREENNSDCLVVPSANFCMCLLLSMIYSIQ
jgi:uncharacterized membrane protein